jgi:hypothetical protein
MFSRLSATALMFKRCLTPTFSPTLLPPRVPQPSVSDGGSPKFQRSPIPPWLDGVFTSTRQVLMAAAKASRRSRREAASRWMEAVWPRPPSSTRREALARASPKSLARYMAKTGESFSWASSSPGSTRTTSPTRIFVAAGTSKPARAATAAAGWPTIRALTAPFMMMVLRILASSALESMWQPRRASSLRTRS